MFMTYTSLKTQLMDWLDKNDSSTTGQLPYFIYQAESALCEIIKTTGVSTYAVAEFTPDIPVYQYPARLRRALSINTGTGTDLNTRNILPKRDYNYVISYTPNSNTTGVPKYYADKGFYNFIVAPTPDAAYPYEISYMGLPEPLTDINQTNWFTNYAPNALLYGSLIEALLYLKDYEQVPAWKEKYTEAISFLTNTDNLRKSDRGSNRDAD